MANLIQDAIFHHIVNRREQQDLKWGVQDHDNPYWLGIMVEEIGEAAKAVIEFDLDNLRDELIDVAAVIFAWLECIERRDSNQQ